DGRRVMPAEAKPGGPVLVERRDPVAVVTLNRPDKHNALSLELLDTLRAVVKELGADPAVRVIVLKGNERTFSTGMDLDDLLTVKGVADTQRVLDRAREANAEIEKCPKPV